MLQNANTKCNGLLPVWGSEITETNFSSSLARHNNFIQECTGLYDHSYHLLVHDLRLLLLRFAYEKSFSAESGGGGPQSNMHLIPYLMHMSIYVMKTYVTTTNMYTVWSPIKDPPRRRDEPNAWVKVPESTLIRSLSAKGAPMFFL